MAWFVVTSSPRVPTEIIRNDHKYIEKGHINFYETHTQSRFSFHENIGTLIN